MIRLLSLLVVVAATLAASDWTWDLPSGFPRPPVPASNPITKEKVELGRHLFYDKRMSVNGKQSCATCHRQDFAFTDGRPRAQGATGKLHPRGSMSLVNIAYAPALTWSHPSLTTLEDQALIPMLSEHPVELGLKGREKTYLSLLERDRTYATLFAKAFPEPNPVTLDNVVKAIAAFERSIVSMRSPYDRYRWRGEPDAISASAKRGELLFSSSERAGCFQCHGGWNFSLTSAASFFNTGVSSYPAPNRGLFEHTNRAEDMGKFRAPTLRNIALTAPYMHDGSVPTLEAVLDHYVSGGRHRHTNQTPLIRPFPLTKSERRDLIEFLHSLTDYELTRDPRWSDPNKGE